MDNGFNFSKINNVSKIECKEKQESIHAQFKILSEMIIDLRRSIETIRDENKELKSQMKKLSKKPPKKK